MERIFSNWIESYLEYTEISEAPDNFHKWTAVSAIAGALRRRVWINMGTFTWTPNFFIFFVAPAGVVSKSTTADIGMDLLRELPYIKFGPSAVTWQALVTAMADSREDVPAPDGTLLPMSPITIVASELGTFLDPRNREMIDVLNSLWDGKRGAWDKITKGSGSDSIINPWINLIGCTTPSWVAENCSDYFHGGGFASRSVFVYAETKRKLVAYPARGVDLEAREQHALALTHDLEVISNTLGEYEITEEAYDFGTSWYEDHHYQPQKYLTGEKFRGYLARKQTHMHKLAMVLAAAEGDELVITPQHLKTALEWVTSLEKDMPAVFGKMNRETEMVLAADVLDYVRQRGKIERTALYRAFFDVMSYDTFEKITRSLINSGLTKSLNIGSVLYLEAVKEEKDAPAQMQQ